MPGAGGAALDGLPEALSDAMGELEGIKGDLYRLTGFVYLDHLNGAWEVWEKTKNPEPFVRLVHRMEKFAAIVRRAERMAPTLQAQKHPRYRELDAGLQDGALSNDKVRRDWEALVDLLWREFLLKAGPFASEILEETP